MTYIAVIGYNKEHSYVRVAQLDESLNVCNSSVKDMSMSDCVNLCVRLRAVPLNFSIDQNRGIIVQDWGSFDRFSKEGCAVIVGELKSKSGMTLGYRLLSCSNGVVANYKTSVIIERASKQKTPFLQNGIIRNNTVACYPGKRYIKLRTPSSSELKQAVSKTAASGANQAKSAGAAQSKPVKFNNDQSVELDRCKKAGIDPKLISDPRLNKQQMRVLWVSKGNGAYSEAFNDPKYSVDQMKFFADRVCTPQMAKECSDLLNHPELSVDEMRELYQCICEGVDYSDLIGKTPSEIMIERENRSRDYWGKQSLLNDVDYYGKAVNVAMKMMGI